MRELTASSSQGEEPADWFLQMLDGRSTVRITPGLLLGESARGDFELGPESASPLVRFEMRDGALWMCVASREWALSSESRMLGDSMRVTENVVLRFPNNDFRVLDSQMAEIPEKEVELIRRPSLSWLKPSRDTAAPGASNREPAGDRIERNGAVEAPELEAPEPEAPEPETPEPEAPRERSARTDTITAFFTEPQDFEPRHYVPDETTESRTLVLPPMARPDLSVKARTPRKRRADESGPSWSVTLAALALYLAGLVFSTAVQTPVLQESGTDRGSRQAEDAFLAKVEELLQQQTPPDPTTLGFAVEAYRAAAARRPEDEDLRRRLAELESAKR